MCVILRLSFDDFYIDFKNLWQFDNRPLISAYNLLSISDDKTILSAVFKNLYLTVRAHLVRCWHIYTYIIINNKGVPKSRHKTM